jgi:GAF domain-containing protein
MRFALERKNKAFEEAQSLHVLLEAIVNGFPEAAGADYSEITLYDDKRGTFTFAAATGPERDAIFSGHSFRRDPDEQKKTFAQKVLESKNPLIIDDVDGFARSEADRGMAERLEIRSTAVFPMIHDHRFLGSISFDYGGHTHHFTRDDLNRMHDLADLAARMIGYARGQTL